jgi:hypothetical protein
MLNSSKTSRVTILERFLILAIYDYLVLLNQENEIQSYRVYSMRE